MDLENIILGKSKTKINGITYLWNLKNNTNELIYKNETIHRHRKQIYGYQRGKEGQER